MDKILPLIIVCGIGIAASLGYIVAVGIKALRRKPHHKREFEIEEDVLVIKLGKRNKK